MSRIVDLTLTYRDGMRGVGMETATTISQQGWNARNLSLYSHAGTHMDAPRHFVDGARTIDDISLSKCVGPAWLIDIPDVGPCDLLGIGSLGAYTDRIASGDRVVLKTGWSAREGSAEYRDELPRISAALARWFVDRGVVFVGVEPPSVADVHDLTEVTEVHRTLLEAEIVIVEGLCNLDALTSDRIYMIALPLKIDAGDGSPCRVIALDEPSPPDASFP
ncbi:cyclase family protein [Candidatus Poribacteria bacterium]|jgi:arylformamidase|nr:cyclase family protein [Candidatus Poribacteria bacterium]MBT5532510.1 cyclase family protein [Candidatus Poribacteria bacterium]MBT5714769.1 cyclase family protein [Candidatus Poribacteria bacterium]MBT7098023.1 cyclase family protein [Candidatus Poribacteria bacterium]MBT7809553.1 cyclase family protein [Candidatus Poribacteria bacterium]